VVKKYYVYKSTKHSNNKEYLKHRVKVMRIKEIIHIISSCTVLAQSEYKKRHDICIRKNYTHEFSSLIQLIKGYTTTLHL
jgi:hypothetical protein